MVDKNVDIYLTYLSELVKDYIARGDKEGAKSLLEIIKTIKAYIKILYLEDRYKNHERDIKQYEEAEIKKINDKVEELNLQCQNLIMEGNEEDIDNIEALTTEINELKIKAEKIKLALSKDSFIKTVKSDDMTMDKSNLIKELLRLTPINVLKQSKFNICEVYFLLDILKGDFSKYRILKEIQDKRRKTNDLNEEIDSLSDNVENMRVHMNNYNTVVKNYIQTFNELGVWLKKEPKHPKLFRFLPFLRFFMVDKEVRENINLIERDLDIYLIHIRESFDDIEKDNRYIGIPLQSEGKHYYGPGALNQDFNINGRTCTYGELTEQNLLSLDIISDTVISIVKAKKKDDINKLNNEINVLHDKIDANEAKIDPRCYDNIVCTVSSKFELSNDYKLLEVILSSLVILNYLDNNFNKDLLKQILLENEYNEFRKQTLEKEKIYQKIYQK